MRSQPSRSIAVLRAGPEAKAYRAAGCLFRPVRNRQKIEPHRQRRLSSASRVACSLMLLPAEPFRATPRRAAHHRAVHPTSDRCQVACVEKTAARRPALPKSATPGCQPEFRRRQVRLSASSAIQPCCGKVAKIPSSGATRFMIRQGTKLRGKCPSSQRPNPRSAHDEADHKTAEF